MTAAIAAPVAAPMATDWPVLAPVARAIPPAVAPPAAPNIPAFCNGVRSAQPATMDAAAKSDEVLRVTILISYESRVKRFPVARHLLSLSSRKSRRRIRSRVKVVLPAPFLSSGIAAVRSASIPHGCFLGVGAHASTSL